MKISEEGIKPILSAMATHSANPSVQEKACGAILNLSEFGTASHTNTNHTVRADQLIKFRSQHLQMWCGDA
jgi:hypothetical protein